MKTIQFNEGLTSEACGEAIFEIDITMETWLELEIEATSLSSRWLSETNRMMT